MASDLAPRAVNPRGGSWKGVLATFTGPRSKRGVPSVVGGTAVGALASDHGRRGLLPAACLLLSSFSDHGRRVTTCRPPPPFLFLRSRPQGYYLPPSTTQGWGRIARSTLFERKGAILDSLSFFLFVAALGAAAGTDRPRPRQRGRDNQKFGNDVPPPRPPKLTCPRQSFSWISTG